MLSVVLLDNSAISFPRDWLTNLYLAKMTLCVLSAYGIIAANRRYLNCYTKRRILACISNVCYDYSLWWSGCSRYKTSSTLSYSIGVLECVTEKVFEY